VARKKQTQPELNEPALFDLREAAGEDSTPTAEEADSAALQPHDPKLDELRRFENASLHYAGGGKENTVFGGFIDSYATADDVLGDG